MGDWSALNALGPVPVAGLYLRAGLRCTWHGGRVDPGKRQIDHVLQRSQGGSDALDNLVLACAACNRDRAGRVFMPERALYWGRTEEEVRAEIERQTSIPIGPGSEIYPRALRWAREWWPAQFERRRAARAAYREREVFAFFEGPAA